MPFEHIPFLRPVFRGERFDEHAMPVEVLAELQVYKDIVVAVAKELFRQNNPQRLRLPAKFQDAFKLELREIGEGSAIPVLDRKVDEQMALQVHDYFDDARDLINQAIEAAGNDLPLPANFPRGVVPLFNSFGKRLRDDESIELTRPGTQGGPRYTKATRRAIVLSFANTYQDDFELNGQVVGLNASGTFTLQTAERSYEVPFEPEFEEALTGAFTNRDYLRLSVAGTGVYSRQGTLQSVDSVAEFTIVDSRLEPLESQIESLRTLEDGWLNGIGKAPTGDTLAWAQDQLSALVIEGVPVPDVFPLETGDLRAEWELGPWDISAEYGFADKSVYIHALNLEDDTVHDATLEVAEGVAPMAEFLQRLLRQ